MNIPNCFGLVDICKTSDGFYLGQESGDCGFNHFIGKPSRPHPGPGMDRILITWNNFSPTEQEDVKKLATLKGINLVTEFGVPA